MRRRRVLRSCKMYDLCFRSLQGLPLPARMLTTLLIESIMARLMTAEDVIVCSYVFMANHTHMQLFSLDISSLTHFHERLKKRLTDFLKKLLTLSHLRLWDDRTTLAEVLDLDSAIDRIAYTFLNPVRAKLASSIDTYSGCNSWKEFLSCPPDVQAVIEKQVPWVLATDLEPLSSPNPSLKEERQVIKDLLESSQHRHSHTLRIYPFKWLLAFGISDPKEVERIRQNIIARVRAEELKIAALNKKPIQQKIEGFVVTDAYLPPKKQRKLFMYGSTKEIRSQFLQFVNKVTHDCRRCYQLLKSGVSSVPWPPQCFPPPYPRLANAL